jgi:hypothetical protein
MVSERNEVLAKELLAESKVPSEWRNLASLLDSVESLTPEKWAMVREVMQVALVKPESSPPSHRKLVV